MQVEAPRGNLQRRVFAVFGGFTLLLCLVYSGIGVLAAYVVEDQLLDNLINDEARHIQRFFREHGELPTPRLPQFVLYTSQVDTPPAFLTALAGDRHKAELFVAGEQHYHLRKLDADTILAAEVGNLLTVSSQSDQLAWLLLVAFLCTSALALWLAHRLVAATIRPVLHLAQEVESQSAGERPLALATHSRDDEIGFLARTLQRNVNELQQARQREAEFTRDVSHELRTSLAMATNTLALSRHRGPDLAESRELRAILATMNRTVTTLLALARAESFAHTTFNLRPLLEGRLLARPEIRMENSFSLQLMLPDTLPVSGNQQLTTLLLDILLDNAIRHASQPALHIYRDGDALVFENPVEQSFTTDGLFTAGTRRENSEGFGQGLYLANRIFTAQRWHFSSRCENQTFSLAIYPARAQSA